MQKYVKRIGDERLTKVPDDLDTKPYRDEHDDDLLRRMLGSIEKGQVPPASAASNCAMQRKKSANMFAVTTPMAPDGRPRWSRR